MNQNRFKTIRSRILLFILPIAVVSMLVLSLISYRTSFDLINTEIDQKMNYVLDQTVTSIQKSLYAHSHVAEALARTVEVTGVPMTIV